MKILFVTDLHGDTAKYRLVLEIAKKNKVKAVINGGDMLCLEDDIHSTQREFIEGFLSDHFGEYEKAGIYHLGYLGNDDLKIHDACFNEICSKHPHTVNLAQARFELESFEFIGMNWVADYPFQLKDRCRRDTEDYVFQRQFGAGVLSTEKGFEELSDWVAHAATLPTIEEELELLPKPKNPDKAVYVMHMPPNRHRAGYLPGWARGWLTSDIQLHQEASATVNLAWPYPRIAITYRDMERQNRGNRLHPTRTAKIGPFELCHHQPERYASEKIRGAVKLISS